MILGLTPSAGAFPGPRGALRYPDCRSRGEPDAGPARTQHTPHVCMLKCSKLSLYCDLYHYLLDFS